MENEILNKILENQNIMQNNMQKMQNDISDLNTTVGELKTDVLDLNTTVDGLKTDVSDLNITVKDIDRVVIKMEYEHGDKIQALLDAVTCNNEKYQEIKKENDDKFNKTEFKIMSHEVRIEKLEKIK